MRARRKEANAHELLDSLGVGVSFERWDLVFPKHQAMASGHVAGRRRELRKMGLGFSKAPSDGKRTWLAPLHWETQIHTT